MPSPTASRELGRGERVLPGVWRLRLPLPIPGVPHCNAWAVAAGDGIVLFDCGMHEPGSLAQLERAMAMVNLRLDLVRLLICTHAHIDHYGQAATVIERAGCELWMHPEHAHVTAAADDPDAALARRVEIARQSGVPAEPLRAWAEHQSETGSGIARVVLPDRPLLPGVEIATDLGAWLVIETPGHAPSHVCLFQPERRLLISGDHLLGRISLYYDYGYTPDPVGEFLHSLETVEAYAPRLCLSGHGRTFADVPAHITANRDLVAQRLERLLGALRDDGPISAYDAIPRVYGEPASRFTASWWLTETLCYLGHLEATGRAQKDPGEDGRADRWTLAA
jgi:glyoxylase-like metal-dependent hydrolase (beta-lactamase superfamily II)